MPNRSDTVSQQITKRLNESARLKEEIARRSAGEIQAIAELIIDAYRNHIIDETDYQAFVWIKDKKILAVTPQPEFKPFFGLQYDGLSQNMLRWRPRRDSNPRSPP